MYEPQGEGGREGGIGVVLSGVGVRVATTEGQLRCECNTRGRVTVYSCVLIE